MIPPRVNRIRLPHPADPGEQRTVLAVLAAVLLLQIELVFNRPVNWDEFYHLSLVHAQAQGRMSEFLQVLHIRLLGWLPLLGLDEIGQIRTARLAMLGCELVTLTAIYALARRFAHRRLALLVPLLYLSAGFVFQHGMSFRADPLVTALLMGALWLLLTSRLRLAALASIALLLALAVLATIKAVLFAPAFAGIAWLRIQHAQNKRDTLVRMIVIGLFAAILLGLFTALVQMGAAPAVASSAKSTLSASGSMLLAEGLFPRWHYLLLAIGTAPVLAAAIAATVGLLARSSADAGQRIALAGLILPLVSVVFFRNAFPYFYAFILAPVVVGVLPGIAWLSQRYALRGLAAVCLLGCTVLSLITPRGVLDQQRQVLDAVHRAFPQPVSYFDFSGMVSAFPKANVFMTTWGQTRYRSGELESYASAMARETVPLLLTNNDVLARNQSSEGPAWELLPADAAALRTGYIQHWGPIWVAGQRFGRDHRQGEFSIHAAGTYTLEQAPALIDGKRIEVGQTVALSKGTHQIEILGNADAVLRWGDHLPRPAGPAPTDVPFKDF